MAALVSTLNGPHDPCVDGNTDHAFAPVTSYDEGRLIVVCVRCGATDDATCSGDCE